MAILWDGRILPSGGVALGGSATNVAIPSSLLNTPIKVIPIQTTYNNIQTSLFSLAGWRKDGSKKSGSDISPTISYLAIHIYKTKVLDGHFLVYYDFFFFLCCGFILI